MNYENFIINIDMIKSSLSGNDMIARMAIDDIVMIVSDMSDTIKKLEDKVEQDYKLLSITNQLITDKIKKIDELNVYINKLERKILNGNT